jgi:hypothetical protein
MSIEAEGSSRRRVIAVVGECEVKVELIEGGWRKKLKVKAKVY